MAKDPFDYLESLAGESYGGEAVTHLDHALQTAALAVEDGANDALVLASLFHDIGHLLPDTVSNATSHERGHATLGARFLGRFFGEEVTEPVRLHVLAKRYLARDDTYRSTLSAESERSLIAHGGVLESWEAEGFLGLPWAQEAIELRRWCDQAKKLDHRVPGLERYRERSASLIRSKPALNVEES